MKPTTRRTSRNRWWNECWLVEIPKFSKTNTRLIGNWLDRPWSCHAYTAQDYPLTMVFVPPTLFDDGDALWRCFITTYPLAPISWSKLARSLLWKWLMVVTETTKLSLYRSMDSLLWWPKDVADLNKHFIKKSITFETTKVQNKGFSWGLGRHSRQRSLYQELWDVQGAKEILNHYSPVIAPPDVPEAALILLPSANLTKCTE